MNTNNTNPMTNNTNPNTTTAPTMKKTAVIFDHAAATADLSQCDAGKAILTHAARVWAGDIECSLNDAYDGALGRAAAELSARLPRYQTLVEVEMTPAEVEEQLRYDAKTADRQARREKITALVIAAITAGNAQVRDTGTNSVSETTLFGGGKPVFVFPHFDARTGSMKNLSTPEEAQKFIDFAAVNYYGAL